MRRFSKHIASIALFGVSILFNLAIQLIVVRVFGQITFGQFAVWRNNVQLLSGLGRLGLPGLIVRESPRLSQRSRKQLLGFAIIVTGIGLSLFGAVYSLGVHPIIPAVTGPSLSLTAGICLGGTTLLCAWIRANGRQILGVFIERTMTLGLTLALVIFIFFMGYSIRPEILFTIALCITFGATAIFVIQSLPTSEEDMEISIAPSAKRWIKQAGGFWGVSIGDTLSARSTLLISALSLSKQDMSELALLVMMSGLIAVALMAVSQIIGPDMARSAAADEWSGVRYHYRLSQISAFGSGLVVALIMFVLYPYLLNLVGAALIVHPWIVALFFAAPLINVAFGSIALGVTTLGLQNAMAVVLVVVTTIKIVALLVLIPLYGLLAIACIEIAATLIWNLWALYLFQSELSVKTERP